MKWYINWLGIRGVNLFIPHAFYYSVEGQRKEERPPDVGPNNIWWNHYRQFSDYIKRISWLMTDSVNGAKVAVLCDNNRVPYRETAVFYENQIEFNYLPGPSLRAVLLQKDRARMYLLSNEGSEKIHTKIWFPGGASLLAADLWKGSFYPVPADYEEKGAWMETELEPCEMLLMIHNGAGESIRGNFTESSRNLTGMIRDWIPNWNQRFVLQKKEHNRAEYRYSFEAERISGTEMFEVTGEEMAECRCNGQVSAS